MDVQSKHNEVRLEAETLTLSMTDIFIIATLMDI